jgi:hypothetical protein
MPKCMPNLLAYGSPEGSNMSVGCKPPDPLPGGPISMLPSARSSSTNPTGSPSPDKRGG